MVKLYSKKFTCISKSTATDFFLSKNDRSLQKFSELLCKTSEMSITNTRTQSFFVAAKLPTQEPGFLLAILTCRHNHKTSRAWFLHKERQGTRNQWPQPRQEWQLDHQGCTPSIPEQNDPRLVLQSFQDTGSTNSPTIITQMGYG